MSLRLDLAISALGVVVSAAAGGLAVLLGWLAYREAAEARRAVAVERRRAFELDVLLRLLESVERLETPGEVLDNRHLLRARHEARLAVIPAPELPAWHALLGGADAFDVVIDDPEARDALRQQREAVGSQVMEERRNRRLYPRIRERLVKDVLVAIEARMAAQ